MQLKRCARVQQEDAKILDKELLDYIFEQLITSMGRKKIKLSSQWKYVFSYITYAISLKVNNTTPGQCILGMAGTYSYFRNPFSMACALVALRNIIPSSKLTFLVRTTSFLDFINTLCFLINGKFSDIPHRLHGLYTCDLHTNSVGDLEFSNRQYLWQALINLYDTTSSVAVVASRALFKTVTKDSCAYCGAGIDEIAIPIRLSCYHHIMCYVCMDSVALQEACPQCEPVRDSFLKFS